MTKYISILLLLMLLSGSLLFLRQQTIQAKGKPPTQPSVEFYQVSIERHNLAKGADVALNLSCDPGDFAVGGGYALGSGGVGMLVSRNEPDSNLMTWEIKVQNNGDADSWVRVRVNCLKVNQ